MNRATSGEMKVSSKTLGHISAGMYRSTAGAIKELVSNSFDADATKVVITTNPPHFDQVTVRDDSQGMEMKTFVDLMDGGIGDSDKRTGDGLSKELGR